MLERLKIVLGREQLPRLIIVDARRRASSCIPHQLNYQLALSKFALLCFRKVRIYAAMPAGKYKPEHETKLVYGLLARKNTKSVFYMYWPWEY